MADSYDAIVVGAGPVGSTAAVPACWPALKTTFYGITRLVVMGSRIITVNRV